MPFFYTEISTIAALVLEVGAWLSMQAFNAALNLGPYLFTSFIKSFHPKFFFTVKVKIIFLYKNRIAYFCYGISCVIPRRPLATDIRQYSVSSTFTTNYIKIIVNLHLSLTYPVHLLHFTYLCSTVFFYLLNQN